MFSLKQWSFNFTISILIYCFNFNTRLQFLDHGLNVRKLNFLSIPIVSSRRLGSGGGMIFVSSARQGRGGQLLNLKSQGGDTFRGGGGEMILGSQVGGGLLYHDELLVFPQNA